MCLNYPTLRLWRFALMTLRGYFYEMDDHNSNYDVTNWFDDVGDAYATPKISSGAAYEG